MGCYMNEVKHIMKNFSLEEQELIRSSLFTNPNGHESFVYPQPLVAAEELSPLMSAYSRDPEGFQNRVIRFLDTVKPEQTRSYLPLMTQVMNLFREEDGTLVVSRRTRDFNQKWVLAHGHNSIKEETQLFGHVDHISDITGKKITGDPRNHPQVQSTRYMQFDDMITLTEHDLDLNALKNKDRAIEHMNYLNTRYVEMRDTLVSRCYDDELNQRYIAYLRTPEQKEINLQGRIASRKKENLEVTPQWIDKQKELIEYSVSEEGVKAALEKFTLDVARVYLPAVTKTSMGFSVDARALESIISDMITGPRIEDTTRGQAIWDEAKKIAPVLLGEKSHISVRDWKLYNEKVLREYAQSLDIEDDHHRNGVRLVGQHVNIFSDRYNAAQALFPHTEHSLIDIYAALDEKSVKDVIELSHVARSQWDVINDDMSHDGWAFEFVMAFHGYRDMYRHRRGSRSVQLLSTRLGFEVPEMISYFGLEEEYMKDMNESAKLYELVRGEDIHIAEKVVPFGAMMRSMHTWAPNQIGYVTALRSDIGKGNFSYVNLARELSDVVKQVTPLTGGFLTTKDDVYPSQLWKKGYGWYNDEFGANQK